MTLLDSSPPLDLNMPAETPPAPAGARRSVAYLAGTLAGGNLLASVFGQVGGLLAAKCVTREAWGLFQTLSIVVGYARFAQLGIGNGLNRELPYFIGKGERQRVKELVAAAQAWMLAVSLVGVLCLLSVAGWYLAAGDNWRAAGWATNAVVLFTVFFGQFYLQVTYRTGHDFARLAMANVVQNGLALLLVLLVALWSFYGLCLRVAISGLMGIAVLYYWRPVRVGPKWNTGHLKHLLIVGAPIFGVGELYSWWVAVLSRTLVWACIGEVSVGYYCLGLQAATALEIIPLAVSQVIYPRMSEKYGRTGTIHGLLGMTVKPILLTATGMLCIIAVSWWLVEPAMRLLLFAYIDAVPVMRWAIMVPFFTSFAPMNLVFNVVRRQDLYATAMVLGMASYGGCLLWLVRGGVTLVAFPQAMLVGQAVFMASCCLFVLYLRRTERTAA